MAIVEPNNARLKELGTGYEENLRRLIVKFIRAERQESGREVSQGSAPKI